MIGIMLSLAPFVLFGLSLAAPPAASDETRISIQVKDADVKDVIALLAEAGGVQLVLDPEVSCRLTLALKEAPLGSVLDSVLRACGLGQEQEGGILRIARVSRLSEEARQRRTLEEERLRNRPRSMSLERLSYARAQEIAPLLRKLLPDGAEVVFDARTNTLIIIN